MSDTADNIYRKLCSLGISRKSAGELLDHHCADYIAQKIDMLEFQIRQSPNALSSPAGYLYLSIRDDYDPPIGYKSAEERKKEDLRRQNYLTSSRKRMRDEEVVSIANQLEKVIAKEALLISADLAKVMCLETEARLRNYIERKRPNFMRSCLEYDLRSTIIDGKPRDCGAGLLFQFLRTDFFREQNPEAFHGLNQRIRDKDCMKRYPSNLIEEAFLRICDKGETPFP